MIDDFAHNPDKLAATLDTLRAFPGRLLLLFQPHGYGPLEGDARRTGRARSPPACMRTTCSSCPIRSIRAAPSPARSGAPTSSATSRSQGAPALHIPDRAAAAAHLVAQAKPGDRIVVMGARDDTLSQLAADMVAELAQRA